MLQFRLIVEIYKIFLVCFRYQIIFCSLLTVGVGSWMFHMTLQYEMQLLDELPMVWGG